ncbi:hypothetical protein F5141DRAFT_1149051 [Pisolithus sp. B1]|nr:hypothetical protein F5141DRAFT_1149051 [Pisolithus sp. B1]
MAPDYPPPQVPGFSSARKRVWGEGWQKHVESVMMCWPTLWASPVSSHSLIPSNLLSTRPRPHVMIKHIRLTLLKFIDHRAPPRVHHLGEVGGVGAMQQTAVSCTTNISSIEAWISFECLDASQFDGRETFLDFSRDPSSGCKCALSNLVCTSRIKGTLFSSAPSYAAPLRIRPITGF